MRIGEFEIEVLDLGRLLMDGGAVFGIIPKPLWQRLIQSDERNRIRLGLNSLLIRSKKHCVVVEAGLGGKLTDRLCEIYSVDRHDKLLEFLARRAITPEAVSHVVLSHLHFLSAGGSTTRCGDAVVPTFPNARYFAQQAEWEEATHPNEHSRGSYFEDDFTPLMAAGKLRLLPGTEEIVRGVEVIATGGHTAGHQIVKVSDGRQTIVFFGHLIPTAWHLMPHNIMAHDLYPAETLAVKKTLLERAVAENWIVCFCNDPNHAAGHVRRTDAGLVLEPVEI